MTGVENQSLTKLILQIKSFQRSMPDYEKRIKDRYYNSLVEDADKELKKIK
jgi:hypothetical protein